MLTPLILAEKFMGRHTENTVNRPSTVVVRFRKQVQSILDYPNSDYPTLNYPNAKMMGQALDMLVFFKTGTKYVDQGCNRGV